MNGFARKQASLLALLKLTQGEEMSTFLRFPATNPQAVWGAGIKATVFSFLSQDETWASVPKSVRRVLNEVVV